LLSLQLSNRLACLQEHVHLAGLLNNTLLAPFSLREQRGDSL